jgi:hypothetical protein
LYTPGAYIGRLELANPLTVRRRPQLIRNVRRSGGLMNMNYRILSLALILMMIGSSIESFAQKDPPNIEVAPPLQYVRLYSDSLGESHFEDLELAFKLIDFAPPAPPISVSQVFDSNKVFVISSPPEWYGDWHPAPQRQFFFALSGELEVKASDGEVRRFGPGSVILVEDTFGKGHISRMVSDHRGYAVVVPIEDK